MKRKRIVKVHDAEGTWMCPPPQVASEEQKSRLLLRAATTSDRESESSLLTAAVHEQLLHLTSGSQRIAEIIVCR